MYLYLFTFTSWESDFYFSYILKFISIFECITECIVLPTRLNFH